MEGSPRRSILVADDDSSHLSAVMEVLERMVQGRYPVAGFEDGAPLIGAYDSAGGSRGVSLVVTDVTMTFDGLKVTRYIREECSDSETPIAVVTARWEEYIELFDQFDVRAFGKPLDIMNFREYVKRRLGLDV